MTHKRLSKGGVGNRDAVRFVAKLRLACESVDSIRAKLTSDGYSKGRISQLCAYGTPHWIPQFRSSVHTAATRAEFQIVGSGVRLVFESRASSLGTSIPKPYTLSPKP